jgi:hypothetical protein
MTHQETTTITAPKRFTVEVLFLNPDDVPHAIAELAAHDIEFKVNPDAVDPCGPTLFGAATGTSELGEGKLFDWLSDFIRRLGGDVVECGFDADSRVCRIVREFTQSLMKNPIGDFVMWTVVSNIDREVHGPFFTRDQALEFAAHVDGSVFEVGVKEI